MQVCPSTGRPCDCTAGMQIDSSDSKQALADLKPEKPPMEPIFPAELRKRQPSELHLPGPLADWYRYAAAASAHIMIWRSIYSSYIYRACLFCHIQATQVKYAYGHLIYRDLCMYGCHAAFSIFTVGLAIARRPDLLAVQVPRSQTCSSTAAVSCWHPKLCTRMQDCSLVDELRHATYLVVESNGHGNVCIHHVQTCNALRTPNQHVVMLTRLCVQSILQIRLPRLI